MQVNDIIHGFRILRIAEVEEIQGVLYEMVHEKTKAKAIWLKRDDENKTFSIAFKTTPIDDTGVFHILEHSVLNGSRKYPVREPFVDLLKGSLQTFLNAMTYPDKTVYPVSSRNRQDFYNLMRVYLDAVFYPIAKTNPNIFYQEGWHYELHSRDEQPIYKGVVFNEMKGSFSSPDSLRSRLIMHSLFPDNCYGNESGGDPDFITDLSYEQFCSSHDRYYAPDNSYIFLDGDIDIDETLAIINDEYLCDFTSSDDPIIIQRQEPVVAQTVVQKYEIAAQADTKGKAQIADAYVIGNFDDYETITAFALISSVLSGNNESPLKKAILENGLGEDFYFYVQDGILQPFVEMDIINTDLEKADQIQKVIFDELNRTVKEGLDKAELEAALNLAEFKAKERDFSGTPKGLVFALSALDSWLYGGDPINSLCFDRLFGGLREKLNTSYYEDLIEKYILNSDHSAKVLLKPSNTLGQEKIEREKEKLEKIAAQWSNEEKDRLVKLNEDLLAWQASEDTPEQKATLPALHLKDLNTQPTEYPLEICLHGGTNTVIKHEQNTSDISYVSLYINTNDLTLEEYTVLGQMLSFMSKLRTEKYDALTLNRLMKSILGDFGASFTPRKSYNDDSMKHYMSVSYSCLHRNDDAAIDLVKEVIYHTDFSDLKAIRDILKQNVFSLEQSFINAGHSLALMRASACSSSLNVIAEYFGGYEAYKYLKNLDDNFDELKDEFINRIRQLQQKLFIKERYTISVSSLDKPNIVKGFIDDAPHGVVGETADIPVFGHRKEAIVIPSNVSFAAKALNIDDELDSLGAMYVISNILTYDYLWNEIRVKGGAYGCGQRFGFTKCLSFYSYRDPDPDNSLKVYTNTVKYLKQFCESKQNIENYIVGTTGEFDPLLSNKVSIRISDIEYLIGMTYQNKKDIYTQILNTTIEDIERSITLFERTNTENNICVVGNRSVIEKCTETFDEILDLYNQ